MPALTSRRRHNRLVDLARRVEALTHELDIVRDRRAPTPQRLAQRGWRVVDDARRQLRMGPVPKSERGKMPFDLVRQVLLISGKFPSPKP
jgi:hypothetical protein